MGFKDITSHDLKLGVRWDLSSPPVYAPPPLIPKVNRDFHSLTVAERRGTFPAPFAFARGDARDMRRAKKFVGFSARSCPIGARDNDWLRLTGDDQRKFRVAMERCDASIFAGGGDVRSGDVARARHAGPAVSPRQLHRGLSTARVNWQGFYIGGQAGYGASDMKFTNSGQDLLAKLLNNVDLRTAVQHFAMAAAAQRPTCRAAAIGGFFGYNWQWTDVVVGVEANYTHGNFVRTPTAAPRARSFRYPPTTFHRSTASSSASMRVTDYGSLRVRGGYAIGCFLPYVFAGMRRAGEHQHAGADP